MSVRHSGIGMTSLRTRVRMVERLREQGIKDEVVLAAMGFIPRHLFVEAAWHLGHMKMLRYRSITDKPSPVPGLSAV